MKGKHPMTKPETHGHDQPDSRTDTITPTSMTADRAEYATKVAAFAALRSQTLAWNRDALCAALSGVGIARVVVRFDGERGFGQITDVDTYAAGGSVSRMPTADLAMQEAVFDGPAITVEQRSLGGAIHFMSYALLEQAHGGVWDAGVGGYGHLKFDVENRQITLEFNKRVLTAVKLRHSF
jgi:hypothetical protein